MTPNDRLDTVRKRERARRVRERLDARLHEIGAAERYVPPHAGWIRAVRDGLGMAQADLARRLGVTQQTVQVMERSEQAGTIRLDTLRRAAEALDCTLAYVFVPHTSLEDTVVRRAEEIVDAEARATAQTMALEAQPSSLLPEARRALVNRVAESGRLWSER
jgi:predicted DNA-binding mobile mystery protein A